MRMIGVEAAEISGSLAFQGVWPSSLRFVNNIFFEASCATWAGILVKYLKSGSKSQPRYYAASASKDLHS